MRASNRNPRRKAGQFCYSDSRPPLNTTCVPTRKSVITHKKKRARDAAHRIRRGGCDRNESKVTWGRWAARHGRASSHVANAKRNWQSDESWNPASEGTASGTPRNYAALLRGRQSCILTLHRPEPTCRSSTGIKFPGRANWELRHGSAAPPAGAQRASANWRRNPIKLLFPNKKWAQEKPAPGTIDTPRDSISA